FNVLYGQSRTHKPQRTQAARKSSSGRAPGGRMAVAGSADACFAYIPAPSVSRPAPPATPAASLRKRRRVDGALLAARPVGCTLSFMVIASPHPLPSPLVGGVRGLRLLSLSLKPSPP